MIGQQSWIMQLIWTEFNTNQPSYNWKTQEKVFSMIFCSYFYLIIRQNYSFEFILQNIVYINNLSFQMRVLYLFIFAYIFREVTSWCLRTTLHQKFQIQQVDWDGDNKFFVTASKGQSVFRIYDARTFEILKVYNFTGRTPKSIKIAKNSSHIAVGYDQDNGDGDAKILLYNGFAQSFTYNSSVSTGLNDIQEIDFSYNSDRILACGDDRFRSYDVFSKVRTDNYKPVPNPNDALACRYGPNNQVAYVDNDKRVRVFDSGYTNPTQFFNHKWPQKTYEVDFVHNEPTFFRLASVGQEKIARFNTTSCFTDKNQLLTITVGKQGQYYAVGGLDKTLTILNLSNHQELAKFSNLPATITSARLSKDQKTLLTGDASGEIRIYSQTCNFYCESGEYMATGKICKKCNALFPFCVSCKSAVACTICMAGYHVAGGSCAACYANLPNCLSCNNSTACLHCIDGFYLDTGQCKRCDTHSTMNGCIECNTSLICTKCFEISFYLDTGTNKCITCASTIPNCIACYNSTVCVECHVGFYEDSATAPRCKQCPSNCLVCQNSGNCTECKTGYWASGGSCIRCTTVGCISCNQTGVCYDCRQGTFLTGGNACTSCTNPCQSCSVTATNCTGCLVGYYLNSGSFTCVKCIQNCKTCNQSGKCLSCFPGFNVDGTTHKCHACINYYNNCSECSSSQCLKCLQGFYIDTAASFVCKTCVSAIPRCLYCSNSTSCQQCSVAYYHTGVTGVNACAACPAGCSQCISAANCTNCLLTYFRNGSNLCQPCKNNCFECSAISTCNSCVVGYYLTTTTCTACSSILTYCSDCIDTNTCVSCLPGSFLDTDSKCKLCTSNCTSCNRTQCYSCEVGYYLTASAPKSCTKCSTFCQQCTSSVICTSCISGYYFDSADNKCKSCSSTFLHCTQCNKTHCLQCDKGTQLNITNGNVCSPCKIHISRCKDCYWDNFPATAIVKCSLCDYGFGIAANLLSCVACKTISGCIECKSATLCTKCEIGFYLKSDNTCGLCPAKCKTCDNAVTCLTCNQGYVYDSGVTNCVLCETKLSGCSKCIPNTATTFNCTFCQVGYYLDPTSKQCLTCHSSISGCYSCNNSNTCTLCLDKYYLSTGSLCLKCVTNIPGCQLCNSSSICIGCSDNYYLDTDNKCYFCSNNIPGCMHCKSSAVCSQCNAGYYLTTGNICNFCESVIEGCLFCSNQANCFQCRSGYYLNTGDKKCYKCAQPGCEICSQITPTSCVTCNSKFYLSATTCLTCRSRVNFCQNCNSTDCMTCQVGYYVDSPTACQRCSISMPGCSRCIDSTKCLQCMSSYFVNTTNLCQQCGDVLFGCQNCIDSTVCVSCTTNFFLNSTTDLCQSCTDLTGCLLCRNETNCVLCQTKYFIDSSNMTCKLCDDFITGCFSCASDLVCVQCVSGYILDTATYQCIKNVVEAKQQTKQLKLVSFYISKYKLRHVLYAKGMNFKRVDIQTLNITSNGKTKLFAEDFTGKQVALTILSYQFGPSGNSIIFYTDNPIGQQIKSKSSPMKFRRLLTSTEGGMEINMQVLLQMQDKIYHEILPQLDYKGSVTVGYSLNSPQFLNSFMQSQESNYFGYQVFGIVIFVLFLINYALKFLFTIPESKNKSSLLPHILALKSCCLIMYPAYFEYVNFCSGFMVVDFPWANDILTEYLTDQSDFVQVPFGLFFGNMSIAGTFLLGLAAYGMLALVGLAYFSVNQEDTSAQGKSSEKSQKQSSLDSQDQKNKDAFQIRKIQQVIGIDYDNDESQGNRSKLLKKNYFELLWNIFGFSVVYYASLSLQGAFYNPIQIITVNGVFYLMGMLLCIYVTIETIYSFIRNFKAINKVRVFLKGCLLSLGHINPIYAVSVCATLDVCLTIIQFYLIKKKNQFTHFFILVHVLSTICLVLMIFLPERLTSLVLTGIFLLFCLGLEIYLHIKEYRILEGFMKSDEFRIDDHQSKVSQQDQIQNNNMGKANVWDIGRKTIAQRNTSKGFKQVDRFATVESFQKQNVFRMDDVDLIQAKKKGDYTPEQNFPSRIKNRQQKSITPQKKGPNNVSKRNRYRKTQQGFKSNSMSVIENPLHQRNQVQILQVPKNKFTLEELASSNL